MANPLPPGVIPKLWRQRNKGGLEVGAYYVNIKKKPVNLRTQDYFKARDRAREALNGQRTFQDDRYFTIDKQLGPMPETNGTNGTPKLPNLEPPPQQSNMSDDWTSDATRAAASAVEPDAYFPPPNQTRDVPKDEPKPETPQGSSDATQIPPELMAGMLKQIANTLVELQLHGQEYLWIRAVKVDPGAVPADHDARTIPAAIWESQLKKWMPTDVPLPEWAVAIILTATLGGTVQFQGAKPLKKEEEKAQ